MKKTKQKNKGFPVYAVYWIDATKKDDLAEGEELTPSYGVTVIMRPEVGANYLSGLGEVFDDRSGRNAISIPAGMVKKIVRVGFAPSITDVFRKELGGK